MPETQQQTGAHMMNRSAIVAAHPDDEILWFSSVIRHVDAALLCFLGSPARPQWHDARSASLREHPIKHLTSLALDESTAYLVADWQKPGLTRFGLEFKQPGHACRQHYERNYDRLTDLLQQQLQGFEDVFTHNPWGEYGNEEHVQVYRVVKELQPRLGFTLWFSNYASNMSLPLMMQYISGFSSDYFTRQIDRTIAKSAMDIYKKHNCWTWFEDWEWFQEESFINDLPYSSDTSPNGHIFPVNLIKFNYGLPDPEPLPPRTLYSRMTAIPRVLRRLASGGD